jgi:hypothetical protein
VASRISSNASAVVNQYDPSAVLAQVTTQLQ